MVDFGAVERQTKRKRKEEESGRSAEERVRKERERERERERREREINERERLDELGVSSRREGRNDSRRSIGGGEGVSEEAKWQKRVSFRKRKREKEEE